MERKSEAQKKPYQIRPRYYRIDGTPYTGPDPVLEWARDFERMKKTGGRIIHQTELENGLWVSTVWLGLDHQFGDGPVHIFETMVFPKGSYSEKDCERYSTREEAEEGHIKMCSKWSS